MYHRSVTGYKGKYLYTYTDFGGLLVCEDLWVDSVELQDEFVHQLRVKSPINSEEGTVLYQLLKKTVCPCQNREKKQQFVQQVNILLTAQSEVSLFIEHKT